MGLLLVYGLNTWLPQIMREADYDLGNSLGFLVILNAALTDEESAALLTQIGEVTEPGRRNVYKRPDGSLTHW